MNRSLLSHHRPSLVLTAAFCTTLLIGLEARAEEPPRACVAPTPSPWSARFAPQPRLAPETRFERGLGSSTASAAPSPRITSIAPAAVGFVRGRRLAQLHRADAREHASRGAASSATSSAPSPAPLPAPATTRTVSIEVSDVIPGRPRQVERFTVPLLDRGSSKLRSRVGNTEYEIGVSREGSEPDAPIGFDVGRSERGPTATSSDASIRASLRIRAGQRATIASIQRSDGSRTEVVATLK